MTDQTTAAPSPHHLDFDGVSFPPELNRFQRNGAGLIKNQAYVFTPEGKVDWKGMLRASDLYVKNDPRLKNELEKTFKVSVDQINLKTVEDRFLCVKLAGIKRLVFLRGIKSVKYNHFVATPDRAATVCEIEFIPNYETQGQPLIVSAMASATPRSVDKNWIPFMETMAENRAFVRAAKLGLEINILNDIEVGGESKNIAIESYSRQSDEETSVPPQSEGSSGGFLPIDTLIKTCRENTDKDDKPAPISFEKLKAAAIAHNAAITEKNIGEKLETDPNSWTEFQSIGTRDAYILIGKIKAAKEAGKKKK